MITNFTKTEGRRVIQKERNYSSYVRTGHGGSTDGTARKNQQKTKQKEKGTKTNKNVPECARTSDPSTQNGGSRGKHVNTFSVVREIRTDIDLLVIRTSSEISSPDSNNIAKKQLIFLLIERTKTSKKEGDFFH